ncbi:MAG: hypothetical protein JSR91_28465 [Proteobacteria bacterium]|nr:hypothetical protein [Pseudomonadota bacterium]
MALHREIAAMDVRTGAEAGDMVTMDDMTFVDRGDRRGDSKGMTGTFCPASRMVTPLALFTSSRAASCG